MKFYSLFLLSALTYQNAYGFAPPHHSRKCSTTALFTVPIAVLRVDGAKALHLTEFELHAPQEVKEFLEEKIKEEYDYNLRWIRGFAYLYLDEGYTVNLNELLYWIELSFGPLEHTSFSQHYSSWSGQYIFRRPLPGQG
jgi:hypothetical protein